MSCGYCGIRPDEILGRDRKTTVSRWDSSDSSLRFAGILKRERLFILRAGMPPYTVQDSRSWQATDPSANTAPSPTSTPACTVERAQTQAFSPTEMGKDTREKLGSS
jgi:hypothetical protein